MNKTSLRKIYLEKRKELSIEVIEKASKEISCLLFSYFDLKHKTISLFLPIANKHEINTFHIWEEAKKFQTNVAISKSNFLTNELTHFLFISKDQLETNKYGIPEPTYGTEINPLEFDFVFIPLLAIDKNGNRVGYGKGFYDRFLKQCSSKCIFVGLHLFEDIEIIDDVNETDVPLHYCITPSKLINFTSK